MKLSVFSIYDAAVGAYMNPFHVRSKAEAIRAFSELVNDPKTNINKHVNDYGLYELGEFDDVAGAYTTAAPRRVVAGTDVLNVDDIFPPEKQDRGLPM